MDIDLSKLNAIFFPYDYSHLLVLWGVLTAFLLFTGAIISASGIYTTVQQFWKMQLAILAGVYLVSAICFLMLQLNSPWIIIVLLTIALIIQGRAGRDEIGPIEDWWLYRLWQREQSSQDSEQENAGYRE